VAPADQQQRTGTAISCPPTKAPATSG